MMEPINLSIIFPFGPEEDKPFSKAVSGEEIFKSLLMSQQPGTEEKDTTQDGNSIEDLTCFIMMGVLTTIAGQNDKPLSNTSPPQDLKDPLRANNLSQDQVPSQLKNDLNGNSEIELPFPSFNLDLEAMTIPEQGPGSFLIASSASQVPFTPDLPDGTLASPISLNLDLEAMTIPEQGPGSFLIASSASQVPFTPDLPDGTLASPISLKPAPLSLSAIEASIIEQLSTSSMGSEQIESYVKTDPFAEWKPINVNQGILFREPNNSKQEPTTGVIPQNIPSDAPGSFSPDQTDHPMRKISAHSPIDEVFPVGHKTVPIRELSSHLNPKVETMVHAQSPQENKGEGKLSFDPPGLGREVIPPSLGVELKEPGKILFGEGGSVLRSVKEDHQNSELFTLLNDQKGNSGSNPLMSEEVQKGHETFLSKIEPLQIYQQIGKRVIWSIRNNEEKIKLTLDPPGLGNIYMEINKEKGNIRATLWTDNPGTKEILEANQIQLHRMLKDDGFKLEKFDVLFQQDMGLFQDREKRSIDQERWRRGEFKEDGTSPPVDSLEVSPNRMSLLHRGDQYIDLFV